MRIARILGQIIAGVLLTLCILVLAGAQFFGIPVVSPFGAAMLSILGPWVVVLLIAIAAYGVRVWRAIYSRTSAILTVAATLAAGWAIASLVHVTTVFQTHGVPLKLADTFAVRILPPAAPDEDIVYSTWQDEPLHVLVYKPKPAGSGASAPTLIYIHGGGFTQGDRFESGTNLRWLANRGWLVLSIDYSLSSSSRHLWDTATAQVGCAMVWAAGNAPRYGGDPTRLSLMGSSAGGNLAINAGYLANAGKLESVCGGTVPRVATVNALYPPVDLAAAWVSEVPVISDMARKFNTAYLGGSPEEFPDRYLFVRSATYINATAPPTLIIFGANDHLVPPEATDRFIEKASGAGIDITSVRFPLGDHAFNLNQTGFGNQFYLGMTDKFLRQHGQQPPGSGP